MFKVYDKNKLSRPTHHAATTHWRKWPGAEKCQAPPTPSILTRQSPDFDMGQKKPRLPFPESGSEWLPPVLPSKWCYRVERVGPEQTARICKSRTFSSRQLWPAAIGQEVVPVAGREYETR
ncbi:hypothetical protein PG984_016431 [Apiospora sp. TS-2023a]